MSCDENCYFDVYFDPATGKYRAEIMEIMLGNDDEDLIVIANAVYDTQDEAEQWVNDYTEEAGVNMYHIEQLGDVEGY